MNFQIGVAVGFFPDFFKFIFSINYIVINAKYPVCTTNAISAFNRMHKVGLHAGELAAHQCNFIWRGRIKMTHPTFMQIAHDFGMRITFHRIKDVAREHIDKALRCFSKDIGPKTIDRIGRLKFLNNIERRIEMTRHVNSIVHGYLAPRHALSPGWPFINVRVAALLHTVMPQPAN